MGFYVSNFNTITLCVAIAIIVIFVVIKLIKKQEVTLFSIIEKAFAGCALTTGFLILLCAFEPKNIIHLAQVHIYLFVAAISLLYISIRTIFKLKE